MGPRLVAVVPHTHWDREWYQPFQRFRLRLVNLLDDLLRELDLDPAFAHFLLDGQMAVVDDYLAVRPEAEPVLRRLAGSGRLAMGPWYTLPDEFLVSGETLIRNLERGLERAAAFGGAMPVGYLPDMFGHVAQMPQLLRQFDIEHAVVWRGVPSAVDRTAFWWEALDGSTVRAEYLPSGYGNGSASIEGGARLVARVAGWEADHASLLGDAPILWMAGTDHQVPDPRLPAALAEADEAADGRYHFEVMALARYLHAALTDGLPRWRGELRSSARANLLMGVTSNRVDVRQAAARAERALELVAEPLLALFLPADLWPTALLDEAWGLMIRNAAHDSVCACSDDEVVVSVLDRYAQARQIAEGLTDWAVRIVGALSSHVGPVVVNTSARTRGGVVELTLDHAPPGTQLVAAPTTRSSLFELSATSAIPVLGELVSWTPDLSSVAMAERNDGTIEVLVYGDGTPGEPAERSAVMARLGALVADRPDAVVRAWLIRAARLRVLARVDDVPGFGWLAWSPADTGKPTVAPVIAEGHRLANGLVTVAAETDGTFTIDGHRGLGRLVDGGDAGDTYNWCPPVLDQLVEGADHVEIQPAEGGPIEGHLVLRTTHRWPRRSDRRRRCDDLVTVVVTTRLTVRAGEAFVRVEHELDNRCEDHRLRVHFPLPRPATGSHAECAFAIVERGLTAEGGPTEVGVPTFPSRRFVRAGGLTVAHEGLAEYELVDVRGGAAHELALTLVRATRMLSQGPMPTRPLPAGPVIEVRGAQVPGRHVLRYVVTLTDLDPYVLAEDAFSPLLVARGVGMGTAPGAGSQLELDGAVVSSVRRKGAAIEVRVFNPTPSPAEVRLPGRSGWLVDLRGRPRQAFDERLPLGPWAIATLRLSER